jgi:hypothetical protein
MPNPSIDARQEPRQQTFDHLFSREHFSGLKSILDSLTSSREALLEAVCRSNSYEDLLGKLGYRMTLTKQIHVQDSFSRLGPAGGIKAVLPYHDIPTQRSLPTLVHFDSTVTTTPESAAFFNQMLVALRLQLIAENQEPP